MNQHEINAFANKYSRTLRSDDDRLLCTVVVNHEDGSHFVFRRAFAIRHKEWTIVFAEHHSYVPFHCEDAIVIMYAPIEIKEV